MEFKTIKRVFFYCFATILLLQVSFFLLSRLTIFIREYNSLLKQRQHDEYIVQSICSLSNVRHRMGDHVTVCLDAEERLQYSLIAEATQRVIDSTHICGSSSCLEIFSEIAAILSDFWLLSLAPVLWYCGSFLVEKAHKSTKAILKQDIDLPQTTATALAPQITDSSNFSHIKFE